MSSHKFSFLFSRRNLCNLCNDESIRKIYICISFSLFRILSLFWSFELCICSINPDILYVIPYNNHSIIKFWGNSWQFIEEKFIALANYDVNLRLHLFLNQLKLPQRHADRACVEACVEHAHIFKNTWSFELGVFSFHITIFSRE